VGGLLVGAAAIEMMRSADLEILPLVPFPLPSDLSASFLFGRRSR